MSQIKAGKKSVQDDSGGLRLGWVDLDLGSSPGWWASSVATYCTSRMVEHPKSNSTQPSRSPAAPDCRTVSFIQFVELKGSVFKKFDKNNLFQVSCSDVRERFHLFALLFVVVVQTMKEYGWKEGEYEAWLLLSNVCHRITDQRSVHWSSTNVCGAPITFQIAFLH